MDGIDGMETARKLRSQNDKGYLIFITVLKEMVFQSFEVQAYDYLIKPINEECFEKTMGRLYASMQNANDAKVLYEDPKKVPKTKDVKAEEKPAKKAEKCTTNTDNVDREIERLKEDKKQLEQQIKVAAGDEEKMKELEKKLAQIEGELSQKDNDTYRRQNAVIS
ncbi:MAG: hypothetical protein MSA09_14540 [Lachnospiraceae bacterium]|nr:hypothetical protein [Lachnospiraceae bacterium]MCI7131737.1 hypothetical protein [Lachnospiraceae bacterium]